MAISVIITILLVLISSFFSMSEISLAASRKMRLIFMAENGDLRANKVLHLQANPGDFFTVVQIGLNAVAIMGGIVGESAFTPYIKKYIEPLVSDVWADKLSLFISFSIVTSLFILLADLMPKRIAMAMPEKVAVVLVSPLLISITILKPLVWFFNSLSTCILSLLKINVIRNDAVTFDDINAIMAAGIESGVIKNDGKLIIGKVLEMQNIPVTAAMTARESLSYFLIQDSEADIKRKILKEPHSKFLVCDGSIDIIKGFINSKKLLIHSIKDHVININDNNLIDHCSIIPDTLSLSESISFFKNKGINFAAVVNEYALVVGIVTARDLQNAVMGDWSLPENEEQIVFKKNNTWVIDGVTPITDVITTLKIYNFPKNNNYETISGFMMFKLKKIPKCKDIVYFSGFKFEVVDVHIYKINKIVVSLIKDIDLRDEN